MRKAPSRTMGQHQPKLPMLLDMSNDHSTNGAVGDAQPVAGADETGFSDRKRPVRPQQDQCWRGASRPATGGSNSRRWRCCSRCCCWPAAAERRCRAVLRSRRASGRRAHAPAQRGSAGVRRAAWYSTSNENGPLHCTAARLKILDTSCMPIRMLLMYVSHMHLAHAYAYVWEEVQPPTSSYPARLGPAPRARYKRR